MKINNPDWFPCYLNPSFNELKELADSRWDTVRILIIDERNNKGIAIASGYGNTHTTIAHALQDHYKVKRAPFTHDFILYKRMGKAYINDPVIGRNLSIDQALREYFTPEQTEILKELVNLSDLKFDS